MNIDRITERIMNTIKNDYWIDLDEDEEKGLKSDIADILLKERKELITLLIQQRNLIDMLIFHKMYPACCTDKIQVFKNEEEYMNFIKINSAIWEII